MGNLKQAHTYPQPKQGLTCQNPFDKLSSVAALWVPVYAIRNMTVLHGEHITERE